MGAAAVPNPVGLEIDFETVSPFEGPRFGLVGRWEGPWLSVFAKDRRGRGTLVVAPILGVGTLLYEDGHIRPPFISGTTTATVCVT